MNQHPGESNFVASDDPESSADFLSQALFSWLNPLFRYGYKKTLKLEDLHKLNKSVEVEGLVERFEHLWKLEAARHEATLALPGPKPSITRILMKIIGHAYFPIGVLKAISDIGFSSAPLLLQALVGYIKSSSGQETSITVGLLYAFGMFFVSVIASVCFGYFFQRSTKYGMVVRGILTAVVYRKALRLSGRARQEFDAGKITNIISSDLVRIDLFVFFFHLAWSYTLITVYVVGLLISVLRVSALAGIAMLLVTIPLQVHVTRSLVKLRKQNATLTDERVRLTSESLSSIRIIKFFAWEDSFLKRLSGIRESELKAVVSANLIRSVITASGFGLPVLAASVSFMVYFATSPTFDPVVIFTALSLFNNLRNPIQWSPIIIGVFADAKVAIERLQTLLESPEQDFEPTYDFNSNTAISVKNGDFAWIADGKVRVDTVPGVGEEEGNEEDPYLIANDAANRSSPGAMSMKDIPHLSTTINAPVVNDTFTEDVPLDGNLSCTLSGINLEVPPGVLVAVVGSVGAGKSSLLSALVGQMKPRGSGTQVVFSGSVGYSPQQPWIMNCSLKDNILFGQPYDEVRYRSVLEACALVKDLEVLIGGDSVEIGEKGINLSGGQKARVSLGFVFYVPLILDIVSARLMYFDSSIILMDDPLSAVDGWWELYLLYVEFYTKAHVGKHIFENAIKNGMRGKTRLLVTHQLHFVNQCDLILTLKDGKIIEYGSFSELMESKRDFYDLMMAYGSSSTSTETSNLSDIQVVKTDLELNTSKSLLPDARLINAEEKGEGVMDKKLFVSFVIAMGGWRFLGIMLCALVLAQSAKVLNDLWLVFWTTDSFNNLSGKQYLLIYLGLGLLQAMLLVLFSIFIAIGGTEAARDLHEKALNRVMHARDVIDNSLIDGVRLFLITFGTAISSFILVAYVTSGWFLILLVPLMAVYYYYQAVYRANARELKRLDALTRSPLYAHVSESITGVSTIRAYREETRFISKTYSLIDQNNIPYYLQTTGARWLGVRLEMIGNMFILFTAIYGVIARYTVNPSLVGLALSYVLQVTQLLSLCIRQFTDAEVQLVSIERMNYYARNIEIDSPGVIENHRPSPGWPIEGKVRFDNLSMRYRDDLPLVLRGIDFEIRKHEKIGVVGRTGSGKSSLMLSLFRILEPASGKIIIDEIDIATLGLKDLRKSLSIIPQDPVLFAGSIRSNLDPFLEYSDDELWESLRLSGMHSAIASADGGLDAHVDPLGENFSVGQRQLLCLARSILRKPTLVVLDECTANVDLETDNFIQTVLREKLKECTILTIAHRLNTVIDYDRILVLDAGKIAQFDTPRALLADKGGIFEGMVKETGVANTAALRAAAGLLS
ncbi:hypothetical protein HDU84_004921 [Entophlyctis sp. JEL0112]|nr:hypothetical protein HDU84_004921 [Entophlyctis sp. JEL0112]